MDLIFNAPVTLTIHLTDSAKLDAVAASLAEFKELVKSMTTKLSDVISQIDAATNAVATRLDALLAKVGTGMSDADVTEAQTELASIRDHLKATGSDPANPVPVVPAEPPVTPPPADSTPASA